MCKRDEVFSSLLCFDIKLLYGRHANGLLFLQKTQVLTCLGDYLQAKVSTMYT